MRGRTLGLCAWVGGVVAIVGCDFTQFERADGPQLLWSIPVAGETDVPLRGVMEVGTDRWLLPRTVHGGSVRLESGVASVPLWVWFDPRALRIVVYPRNPLLGGVTYRLVVSGVRDLDGAPLAEDFVAGFRTGTAIGVAPPRPAAAWREVQPIFSTQCATAACHAQPEPALGLDLSSGPAVGATAVGVVSSQFPRGTTGPEGARGAWALSALQIVDPGRPDRSYLLLKALADPHRLGDAMPPGGRLAEAELAILVSWILGGAPIE